ncbi:MAG: translocation/assembly module TamB domain-containing protein [Pyrinomonadaceae bacterium]
MPDEEVEQREDNGPAGTNPPEEKEPAARRSFFTKRNALIALGLGAAAAVVIVVIGALLYRGGIADSYIKAQFVSKMAEIGVDFDADVFRVTVAPLRLELKNATFKDRVSGEKLAFIREAHLGLTVEDLYAWQLSRDISINTTDITGAEVWVKFDENGRSNFSNLNLVVDQGGSLVNFKYESTIFSLRDSVVHFGDLSRKIAADARNIVFLLQPEDTAVPVEQMRYGFDLTSTESRFVHDGRELQPLDIRATGTASRTGAEIRELRLTTPIGTTSLNGTLTDWASLSYDLNIESTVDLTQASSIFPLGAPIAGIGNFKGKVSGSGETYRVEGVVDSQSLTAEGIYLKGINVAATVEGTNSNYTANGNAVAELLTFEDFRVEFPKLAGNVRGTGTDFRWVGELQAVAAKTDAMTIGGLFLSDAVAEYKDKQLSASAANGRARKFSIADNEFAALTARNLRFSMPDDNIKLDIESVNAGSLANENFKLNELRGRGVKVRNTGDRTDVEVSGLQAQNAEIKGNRLNNVTADQFKLTDVPNSTDISATNLRAARLNADGTVIEGLYAPEVALTDTSIETRIYADELRVAKIDADAAVLGSLNIAGVRLTIREGRIEGTSNDIDAGNVTLAKSEALPEGGSLEAVKIAKPVFVLEPSGRYRASADMSLGGGIVGSIPLGAATAQVVVNNNGAELTNLTANVMEGTVTGNATVAFNDRSLSVVNADFNDLDLGKLAALQGGRVMPLEGSASGRVDLSLTGTDYRTTSGTINASIAAAAGSDADSKIPINGIVAVAATNGLFTIDQARLTTPNSELTATGRFDLRSDDSNLNVALRSTRASEILNIARITGVAEQLEPQIESMQIAVGGDLAFDGTITGNLTDPTIDGKASLASVSLRGRDVGALTTDIFRTPLQTELRNGRLRQADGGLVAFNVTIPSAGMDNISVDAELTGVNAGNLLAAVPVELPERLRDFNGKTSGTVVLSGLPNNASGEVNIASEAGTIAGQSFDSLTAKAVFNGTRINIENTRISVGTGAVTLAGFYDTAASSFAFDLKGSNVPLPLALAFLPPDSGIPAITGTVDLTATAAGEMDQPSTIDVNFNGTAANVAVGERALGPVTFQCTTNNQLLRAELVATVENRPQTINATLNFADPGLPFNVQTSFDQSPLGPFIALIPQLSGISIEGVGTGEVVFGGNLAHRDSGGNVVYSAAGLSGSANFTQLALRLQDTPINAVEPVVVRFDTSGIEFESARFAGGGSNLTITGSKALAANAINNLSVDGRINLSLLNVFPQISSSDTFFGGFADVSVRIAGPNTASRLSGTATLDNASLATFVGSDRLTINRLEGAIRFTSNQVQADRISGVLGGGDFVASGGAVLGDSLRPESFRFDVTGNNITVPLPEDFITTGDAKLEISGRRVGNGLSTMVAGSILARRSVYTQDIDLASLVSGRGDTSLSSGGSSSFSAPRFDLVIEGRDALVVRNNVADLTASVSLRLTGTTENPRVSGRITANSGTVFFRKDRYIVQRGVLEFPPNTEIEPVINLQAESEISGYQIFVNLNGPLTETEDLSFTVRSSPALPQADVVSLITTGNLSNTEAGIPTLAQTGINTAAEMLADSIINNPARKATDKLFGLNVFEIDPIISGQRNASARLTVGRQINNNLRVTYSTNLSQDQNQVLALEYRVSNKLSFVAQYEQSALSNVTQDRNSFSFEVRFRRRF